MSRTTSTSRLDDGSESQIEMNSPPTVTIGRIFDSKNVTIGTKVVEVTQNVTIIEGVKEPLHCMIWKYIKGTTRAERLTCGISVFGILICIFLIIYFVVASRKLPVNVLKDWYVTREDWGARNHTTYNWTTVQYEPLRLVMIQHTAGDECTYFEACSGVMRNLQDYFLTRFQYDIPYNFLVGNDGRVYEGRGWTYGGAHGLGYNKCCIGIGFTGDYRVTVPSQLMVHSTMLLIEAGIKLGHIHPEYVVNGASDLYSTGSPGVNLLNEIQTWDHYDHQFRFRNKSCDQIQDMFA